ncbi:MAG: hypothetical protein Q8P67_07135 [archaeon]|nr:hypothetical protein [archaeon]
MLFKTFEFCQVDSGRRGPLYALVEGSFPTVLGLMNAMCEVNTAEAREVQRWCVRLFYSALNVALPPFFLSKFENFQGWMDGFLRILTLPHPPGEPTQSSDRDNWAPWKLRKWIFHSFIRLISRYAAPRKSFPQEWVPFSKRFVATYSIKMLQSTFSYLEIYKKTQFLPGRLLQCLISFIDSAYRFKDLYEQIKPRFGGLLTQIIIPILSFTAKDFAQWRDDPTEYLRQGNDPLQEYYDPRKTAVSFLSDLMVNKTSDLLKPFADHLVGVFQEFARAEVKSPAMAGKFSGALFCLGIIHNPLVNEPRLRDGLEGILRTIVIPALTSKFPFIRARALWCFATFSDIPFKDAQLPLVALNKVLALMTDTELPVKVEAVMTLRTFLEHSICHDMIRGHLPRLIDHIFKLFKILDHDELVQCLEMIIIRFEREIHPFAKAMMVQFHKEFNRLMVSVEADQDDLTGVAIDEILRAAIALLAAIRRHPNLYPAIEGPALSMVKRVLNQDCIDFVEHGIKILSLLTYFPDRISDNVWSFYRITIQLYRTWGCEFLGEMIPVWDNFITNDPQTFLRPESSYLEDTMRIIETCFKGKGNFTGRDYDCAEAAKLVEVLLQALRENIDKYLPGIMNMIISRLKTCKNKGLNVLLITALANCFFYNPMMAVNFLENKKITKNVLQLWVTKEPSLKKLYDLKLSLIGFSAIFKLPLDKAPKDLQQAMPHIIRVCLKIIKRMNDLLSQKHERKEQKKQLKEKGGTSGILTGASNDEQAIDGDQRHGIEDFTLAEIRELQQETAARINNEYIDSDSSDDSSDDDFDPADGSDDDDISKEPAIPNLVDETDELVYFVSSLKEFSQRLPAVYKKLHDSSLSLDQQGMLKNIIKEASGRGGNE